MTPEGEALVRASWPRIASGGTALAERFYARLFEIAPEQRELFVTTDMAKQQEKFLVMLQDQFQHLLSLLRTDQLRQVAQAYLEGKSTTEIAQELQVTRRSIERKLKLIREDWERELADDD